MTSPIESRPLMRLRLTTSPTQEIGSTPDGRLKIFPVTGGSFKGERLRGKVLAGGGDWVTVRSNGTITLDLRITLETDDGSLIDMTFTGIRDDPNGHPHRPAVRNGCTRVHVSEPTTRRRHRRNSSRWTGSSHRRNSLMALLLARRGA